MSVLGGLAALLLAPLAVPAVAAATPANAIVVVGSATANSWVADDSNSGTTVEGTLDFLAVSAVLPSGQGTSTVFFGTYGAGAGEPLPTAGQHPVSQTGPLRLEIGDRGVGCFVEGTVDVVALTFDGSDQPTSLALDWTGDCGGATSGQVRVASTVPYGGLDVVRSHTWFEPWIGEPNAPYEVVVTGHGTAIPSITSVSVVPPGTTRQSYVVRYGTDTCTGTTLADGQTCSVTVDAAPWDPAEENPTNSLRLQTATGSSSTTLTSLLGPLPSRRGLFAPHTGRVMDTRTGLGVRQGTVGAGTSVTLKVTGGAVPTTGTGAAVLNLTVTGSTSAGYVTAYPAGTTRPTASSINFPKGWTGANLVTVPIGSNGSVTFYNHAGSVNLVADLVGVHAQAKDWSATGFEFHPHAPTRVFDSRTDWGKRLGPNEYLEVGLDYGDAVNAHVHGVVANVTVTGPTGTGYLSALAQAPIKTPATSTLNYSPGLTAANMAVIPATGSPTTPPTLVVANTGSASTHVVVDVVGYFADYTGTDRGLRFRAVPPTRILDTRKDLGLASLGSGVAKRLQVAPTVAGRDSVALVGNLTGVTPSAMTYLTAWATGTRPAASNLNLMQGVTRANSAWPGLDVDNGFRLQNYTGSVETVMDATGTFEAFPPSVETLSGVPYPAPPVVSSPAASAEPGATTARGPRVAGPVPTARSWVGVSR